MNFRLLSHIPSHGFDSVDQSSLCPWPDSLRKIWASIKRILHVLVVPSFVLSTVIPSWAQETPSKDDARAPASSDVQTKHFEDWTLRCITKAEVDEKSAVPSACEIAQPLMVNQDGKSVEVLSLAVSRANDKAGRADWAMVVLTPLDVHLASDFGFAAGNTKPSLMRYRNCNHLGCFVIVPLDRDRLGQMKKASSGTVYFRLLNNQTVKVSFSLKGFTKAFDALSSGSALTVVDGKDETKPSPESGGTGN